MQIPAISSCGPNNMSKSILLYVALVLIAGFPVSGTAQLNDEQQASQYDEELARELDADEYGMKSYVFVTLKTGRAVVEDEQVRKEIFAGHFANMGRLAEEGKLVLAGPLIDARPKRGIFIFNVATIEEAEALVNTDPAVKAGVFDYEMLKLYSSAALMKINDIHATIQKTGIE